jgi:glycine cleavage system H protein
MRPTDIQYTKEHEWIRREGEDVIVGITDYAAHELGDIVFIELPDVGMRVEAGESFGSIETVKAVEDLYAPVSGIVVDRNPVVDATPEQVNEDPFGEGWLVRVQVEAGTEVELLSAQQYANEIGED